MKPAVIASVIICTRNRAPHLARTLGMLEGMEIPEDIRCELILVDNGSTDGTAAVIEKRRFRNMSVRRLWLPRPGKSHCLNLALRVARGGILLFTDDDVLVPSNWISGMCADILAGKADAVAGRVRITPHLCCGWMGPVHRAWVSETAPERAHGASMVGASMAFSREVLTKVPGFDIELGPGALGYGEETLFSWQIRRAGYRIIPADNTIVEHDLDPERLSRSGFLEMARRQGRSLAFLDHHWKHRPLMFSVARLTKSALRLIRSQPIRHNRFDVKPRAITESELLWMQNIHLYRHHQVESKRPPKYAKYGLVELLTR